MFETNEWDIDEDYLKDFSTADDVIQGFNNERQINVEKSDNENRRKSLNTSKFEFNGSAFENDPTKLKEAACMNTASRKNAVLDIFKNSDNIKSTNKPVKSAVMHNINQTTVLPISTANNFTKHLVLDVFQRNEDIVSEKNCIKRTVVGRSVVRISQETSDTNNQSNENNENQLKRKKNVAFSESINDSSSTKKKCPSTSNVLCVSTKKSNLIQNNDMPTRTAEITVTNKNRVNDRQKEMLVDLIPAHKNTKSIRARAPQAVTRKFPGPAGLLLDDVNESEVIDLESVEENKNNKTRKYVDICSQNTKNLFSTGAWQLMTDDLPANFELCDIASIKENALEYSKAYKKIPYLAGIIQYIDYKPNDPQVILKDLTGKIDARIHHSICKLYPNALGTQIVILVKDVGLIVTSKKYVCLIISLKNLVSLYSDETRLVETPHLEELLDNNFNCNFNESQISLLNQDNENNHKSNEKNVSDSSEQLNNKQQTMNNVQLDDLQNFDFDENDSWLAINLDNLNSVQNHQFPSSTPMDINERNNVVNQSKNIVIVNDDSLRAKISHKIGKEKESEIFDENISKRPKNLCSAKNLKKNTNIFRDIVDDSDDEILSQLDVDAIAARYNG